MKNSSKNPRMRKREKEDFLFHKFVVPTARKASFTLANRKFDLKTKEIE